MSRRMDIVLTGTVFTDYLLSDVGAGTFELLHDWFTKQDLVIRDAGGGGGNLLVEGVDYVLSEESTDLSARVSVAVGAGRNVYHLIAIINVAYQAGDLYFSGKYIADSVEVADFPDQLISAASWQRTMLMTTGPFEIKPWSKALVAMLSAALFTGTADTDVSMALKDTAANFATVSSGDIVWNTDSHEASRVLYKSGADTLYLVRDIFPAGNENYAIYLAPTLPEEIVELSGVWLDGDGTVAADTNTLNHLIDGDGTNWVGLVSIGDWAMNLATGLVARVNTVAAHDLTLDWDAFPNGNEKYMIFAGTVEVSDVESPLDGWILPEMNVSGRVLRGGFTGGFSQLDAMQGYKTTSGGGGGFGRYGQTTGLAAARINNEGSGVTSTTGDDNSPPLSNGANGTPRIADQTRMRNVETVWVLRIK